MPIINTQGQVLAGTGGIQGSLDGELLPFPSWGGGCWQTAELALVNLRTDRVATWLPDTTPVEIARGSNDLAAGGNAWVAWRSGYGVFGDLESRLLGQPGTETPALVRQTLTIAGTCGPRAVGPDGTSPQPVGRRFGAAVADGRRSVAQSCRGTCRCSGPASLARRGRRPAGDAAGAARRPQNHRIPSGAPRADWVLYWSETCGLVLQEDGAPTGWILETRPLAFNPSCAVVGTELQIAWSTTQGEGPHDIVVCALVGVGGGIVYRREAVNWTAQVPVWSALPPPEPVVQPTFTFTHPVMVRPFFAEGSGKPDVFTLGRIPSGTLPRRAGQAARGRATARWIGMCRRRSGVDLPLIGVHRLARGRSRSRRRAGRARRRISSRSGTRRCRG